MILWSFFFGGGGGTATVLGVDCILQFNMFYEIVRLNSITKDSNEVDAIVLHYPSLLCLSIIRLQHRHMISFINIQYFYKLLETENIFFTLDIAILARTCKATFFSVAHLLVSMT